MYKEYSPIDPDFYDILEKEISKKSISVVNYFGPDKEIEDVKGNLKEVFFIKHYESFLVFETDERVRLDRLITINGIPGPAYDEYDSYALACLECSAGMESSDS